MRKELLRADDGPPGSASGKPTDALRAALEGLPERGWVETFIQVEDWRAALAEFDAANAPGIYETVEEANAAGVMSGTLANGDTFGDEDDGPEGGYSVFDPAHSSEGASSGPPSPSSGEHQSLSDRVRVLEEALSFYADPERYKGPNQRAKPGDKWAATEDFPYIQDVTRDGGNIARAALSNKGEGRC